MPEPPLQRFRVAARTPAAAAARPQAASVRATVTRVAERLDDEKLAQLRAWAETLLLDGRADMRAAARGLLMLADEVDHLRRAGRTAFAGDIGSALAQRLGTEPAADPGPDS